MSDSTPRPPLPRWIWIAGAAVVAAAVVVGVVLWAQRPTDSDTGPTPTATEPAATPGADPDIVTGCLAEGQGVEMLLTTQEAAPQTEAGAVEFATAAMKWPNRWPWPSAQEYEEGFSASWVGAGRSTRRSMTH